MSVTATDLISWSSFQRGAWHQSRDSIALLDGSRFSRTPDIDVIAELMLATPVMAPSRRADRVAIMRAAARLFRTAAIDFGNCIQTYAEFAETMRCVHGISRELCDDWGEQLERGLDLPPNLFLVREGIPILISLPANTFLCLESVFASLWQGHRIFVRPSQREPWSAMRLVAALVAAGWPRDMISLVNLDRAGLARVLPRFDHAILYGGHDLHNLRDPDRPGILIKGAGCAVAVIGSGWNDHSIYGAAGLVARSAGRLCTNVRWLLVEDRPAAFAEALTACLAQRISDANDIGAFSAAVTDPTAANHQFHSIVGALRHGDRLLGPRRDWSAVEGANQACVIAHIHDVRGHPLLTSEPLFPLALVTKGGRSALDDIFAHSAFVYSIDPAGSVATLRYDSIEFDQDQAA
jgi:acyl-CoA reductase-like NAD-dependent aldehyde dehydrogenase